MPDEYLQQLHADSLLTRDTLDALVLAATGEQVPACEQVMCEAAGRLLAEVDAELEYGSSWDWPPRQARLAYLARLPAQLDRLANILGVR